MTLRPLTLAALALCTLATIVWGVPALTARGQESDAIRELARIARAAAIYYVKPKPGETGGRMICQFPRGSIRTIVANSCCDKSVTAGGYECDPSKIEWNRTLWKLLHFQLSGPTAFVYAYEAEGTLGDARYTASAYGDLDCDGTMSTFRIVGRGDPRSRPDDCLVLEATTFEAIQPDE